MSKRASIIGALVFLAVAGGGAWQYQQRQIAQANTAKAAAVPPRPVPVTIAAVEVRDVPFRFNVVGRTEAYSSVTLKARIDGQITAVQYTAGQTIRRGQPMVTLDARALQAQMQQVEANLARDRMAQKLRVEARPPAEAGPPAVGELAFIDNTVDSTTGTIQMKARFDNTDGRLTPGQFVEVAMTLRDIPGALLIPTEAMQAGPNGNFVYVAKPDQTVEVRRVQTLPAGRDRLIVEKGLAAGEKVVTDGQLRLTPVSKYEVRTDAPKGGGPVLIFPLYSLWSFASFSKLQSATATTQPNLKNATTLFTSCGRVLRAT